MKMFKKDLKDNLKSSIIWTSAASFMAFLTVSIYDSMIATSADQWNEMMETLPEAVLDAFQITAMSFNNILNYYAVEGYLYVSLLISIFSALLGARLINKEESEKTVEFALTKPISRFQYITEKLTTLIVMTTVVNIIVNIVLYMGMLIGSSKGFSTPDFMLYAIGTYLLTISFGLLSFMIACILKRKKGLTGVAIGTVFLSFFLGIISNISDTFVNLKYLSLFEYVDPMDLLDKGFSVLSIVIFAIVIIGTIIISYSTYIKKDIYN